MSEEAPVPMVGRVLCMGISLLSATTLASFLKMLDHQVVDSAPDSGVVYAIPHGNDVCSRLTWRLAAVVFAIYIDSYLFVFATAILQQSVGVNSSLSTCEGAILLCLACYVSTKFIYLFLVEKAHFVRGTSKKRMRSKLYMFNCFGMLGLYIIVGILNVVFRIAKLENGVCVIGMKSVAMIPLLSFDTVANIYLTILFLVPLRNLYSYRNLPRTPATMRLRVAASRTLCGAVATLLSSIVNIAVLMALKGEAGWICLLCCNCDILFSAAVIQWITSKDNAGTSSVASTDGETHGPVKRKAARGLPCRALQSVSSAPDKESLSATDLCSTRSAANSDGPLGSGGILVTTTIKTEEMEPRGSNKPRDARDGTTTQVHDAYAAEEGRVVFDRNVDDGYGSRAPGGCGAYETVIVSGSGRGAQ
ncbi:uncharacterized protein MAM_08144 [Metarhizium album ARSEF 1941]|uniref:Uncharacterized protein n=1 Tax=Metarhizium album (strain ARSEF 1941) TaxID=1081103 RepID=A0A0B2WLX1_METAS|nr:uncharacterized protein MAM_08144 [Metarhizium album ARSEF 1941]KHN94015.1 hypothetical protein MAM_08144 [Metarhizium album ARSEF 1941]